MNRIYTWGDGSWCFFTRRELPSVTLALIIQSRLRND